MVCGAQIPKEYKTQQKDSIVTYYYIVQGDTIPREYIDLEEVVLLNKLSFNNKVDRRRYLILRRKTRKVYPYAKLASERLLTMTKRLQTIKKKRQASKYTKRIQKYIEQEFSEKLKRLVLFNCEIDHAQSNLISNEQLQSVKCGFHVKHLNLSHNNLGNFLNFIVEFELINGDMQTLLLNSCQLGDEVLINMAT